jgi:hypothetical protein
VGATEPLAGFVKDVTIADNTAYVVDDEGLWVVDISNPAYPTEVGFYDTPGYAEGVTVAGQYAYVADGWAGLRVVDVSDQANPTEVGFVYTLGYAFDAALAEDIAYIAGAGAGLRVVDISNPFDPIEVGFYDTPGYAHGIAVADDIAYIADEWEGLRVVDVSNPIRPAEVGFYDTPGWSFNVAVVGTTAYIADAFAGLRVVDISVPANPTEIGAYEVRGHAGQIVVAGGIAYVADRDWGLRVVDVSNPIHPAQVGFYGPLGYADGVAVAGDYAYVAAGAYGMRVVNISDPSHPTEVGAYETNSYVTSVAVAGNYAYVATIPGQPGYGLHVVDISDPTRPTMVGFHRPTGRGAYRDMAVAGGIAYLANESGLELVSVSDPLNPTRLGFFNGLVYPSEAVGVAVSGNLAYVAVSYAGLKIVDVSDPSNPSLVGVCDELHFSQDVAIAGDHAYVADHDGLRVVDVSDPTHPTVVGFYETPGHAYGVAVAGTIAYVADGGGGLSAVDVSDPSNSRLAASYNTPGYTHELVIIGNYAYVADGNGGLLILEMMPNSGTIHNPSMCRLEILGEPGGWITQFQAEFAVSPKTAGFHSTHPATLKQNSSLADYQPGERHTEASPAHHPDSSIRLVGGSVSYTSTRTWVITSPADSGPGTLRWCLENAANGDTITFDSSIFPPTSPMTIHLTNPLPYITQGNLTIDASNAGVILDGSLMEYDDGLHISSNNNTITGLQILNFPASGVAIWEAKNNVIGGDRMQGNGLFGEGNLINGNGRGEWGCGIDIRGIGAMNNIVEGNVISGNGHGGWGSGICITGIGAMNNIVIGNFIGTDASGLNALGNRDHGVFIADGASHNRVGGTDPGERNIISGNGWHGVSMLGAETTGNIVIGNYIGTDVSGMKALGNQQHGIGMELGAFNNLVKGNLSSNNGRAGVVIWDWGSSYNTVIGNLIGTDVSGTLSLGNGWSGVSVGGGALFNRIGGTIAEERNIISGNETGVLLGGPGGVGNLVLGNFIGTDVTGTRALSNVHEGVTVGGARFFVGGMTEGERNVISGNGGPGVDLSGSGVEYNWVAGNYIGTDASGGIPLSNGLAGIRISRGAQNNTSGPSNLIAHHDNGVLVEDSNTTGNTITRNSVTNNEYEGIALRNGGNTEVPPPTIANATCTLVFGTACAGCTVEIFSDPAEEGKTYEGTTTADGAGNFTWVGSISGPFVTATATDPADNTSEFSAPMTIGICYYIYLPVILKSYAP